MEDKGMASKLPRHGSIIERLWRLLLEKGPLHTADITAQIYDSDESYTRYSRTYNNLVDLERRGLVRREVTGPQRNAPLLWHAIPPDESDTDVHATLAGLDAEFAELERLLSKFAQHLSSAKAAMNSLRQ